MNNCEPGGSERQVDKSELIDICQNIINEVASLWIYVCRAFAVYLSFCLENIYEFDNPWQKKPIVVCVFSRLRKNIYVMNAEFVYLAHLRILSYSLSLLFLTNDGYMTKWPVLTLALTQMAEKYT